MNTTTPIFEVSAIEPERPSVLIRTRENPDGQHWELRGVGEFGLVELQRLQTLRDSVAKLQEFGEAKTIAQAEQQTRWIDEMLDLAFYRPIAPDVLAELSDIKKLQIVDFVNGVWQRMGPDQTPQETTPVVRAKKPTGAK